MTDPMELVGLVEARIGQDFDGECHLTEEEAHQIAACIREMVEWQPIETAPRDGTEVLGLVVDRFGSRVMAVEFNDSWYGDETRPWWAPANLDEEYGGPVNVTHWLPLPPAPGVEA